MSIAGVAEPPRIKRTHRFPPRISLSFRRLKEIFGNRPRVTLDGEYPDAKMIHL